MKTTLMSKEELLKLTRQELWDVILEVNPALSAVSPDGCSYCHRGYMNKEELVALIVCPD